jgi:hypothetical protein
MFDQMLRLPRRPIPKLDIFLCSNGGSGTVPWRMISLFREYARKVCVLLPYRAYSAATMLSIGADEIVMHPFAEMGPIDPTVSNDFNPVDPTQNRRLGISVEDVKAYISFIKTTVGIQHEDELVKAIEILAQKVHPLALGNVERFLSQSRMIAKKIMRTHMDDLSSHKIDEIVENLASKLYFHGHPINRAEAKTELGLKVVYPGRPLEDAMWKLYLEFETDLKNRENFDIMGAIFGKMAAQRSGANIILPQGAAAPSANVPIGTDIDFDLLLAFVEGVRCSSYFKQKMRFVVVGAGANSEPLVRQEITVQQWEHSEAPKPLPS